MPMGKKLRVALVFGGRSGEHEISLMSARSIFGALDRDRYEAVLIGIDRQGRWRLQDEGRALLEAKDALTLDTSTSHITLAPGEGRAMTGGGGIGPVDVVFPVLHGPYGEDGTVQGLLEMAGVPYVGAGVLGSSVGMDKDVAKRLLRDAGVRVVEYLTVHAGNRPSPEKVAAQVEDTFGFPCFVKPANLGSSVGVHRVRDAAALEAGLADAFRYDRKVLVERAVSAREIECSVLGNEQPRASLPGEIVPHDEFYSYRAKYIDENGAALLIPADLSPERVTEVQETSIRAFLALELAGMARVDFLLEHGSGRLYLNEVNTIPGFTKISMYPKLWDATGLPYAKLVDRLIELALERHALREKLSTEYSAT